ncbi:MAG: hypothetical protein ACKOCT_15125 [Alphaproteobacteria bacterium]
MKALPNRPGPVRRAAAVAIAAALLAGAACSAGKRDAANNPFGDPFFDGGFGTRWSDEVLHQRAPSVGWLNDKTREPADDLRDDPSPSEPAGMDETEMLRRERSSMGSGSGELLGDSGDPDVAAHDGSKPPPNPQEKPFSEKAEEAAVSTLGILIGAGMTALPFLLGT